MVAVTREEAPYFGCFNERRDFQQVAMMREDSLPPMAIGLSICPVPREERHPREDPIDPLCSLTLLRGTGDFLGRSSAPMWGPSQGLQRNRSKIASQGLSWVKMIIIHEIQGRRLDGRLGAFLRVWGVTAQVTEAPSTRHPCPEALSGDSEGIALESLLRAFQGSR